MNNNVLKNEHVEEGNEWLSISDMMTGLMVIFLFIAISYMLNVQNQNKQMLEVAQTYEKLHNNLITDLTEEFKEDLPRWSARLDSTSLSIRFTEPDVLFEAGEDKIKQRFSVILNDFFPRYINILTSDRYKNDISEVRIEGHTSSEWNGLSSEDAYFANMNLSQSRTRSVLHYVLNIGEVEKQRKWLISHFTANGLSSSKLIIINGIEDRKQSRRVEFRVRTDAESRINKIMKIGI